MTRVFVDDERVAEFILDYIDYNESEYINAHIDYPYYKSGRGYLQHISPLPGEKAGVYRLYSKDGLIYLSDTLPHDIRIETGDAAGNFSYLKFKIQFSDSLRDKKITQLPHQDFIPNYVNVLEKQDFEAYLPEGCIYDTLQMVYYRSEAAVANAVSAMHQLNNNSYPIHGEMSLRIKPTKEVKDEWKDKIVIQRNNGNALLKPQWQNGWLSFKTGTFGSYVALLDLAAPVINDPGVFKKGNDTLDLSQSSKIVFTPTDLSGIIRFRAELDSNWLMFTNDKGRSWVYNFDERCPYGIHHLKATAEDLAGNITTKEWWFKKYPYTPPKKKPVTKKKKTVSKKKPVKKT
jgi:hypothetical protein